jgi:hypothetical protein
MFVNYYRDGNKGITLLGIRRLGKIESSRKKCLIDRNIKNIQISWLNKLKEAAKIFYFS